MKRRTFIKSTLAASLAGSATLKGFAIAKDNPYRANIGIQLYTLRNQIAEDALATLKAVAAAGYKQVEAYGFSDQNDGNGAAGDLIRISKDLGMAANSSHFAWQSITSPGGDNVPPFEKILEQAHAYGLTHLVIPYLMDNERGGLDAYKALAEKFNKAAELADTAGIQLCYHNHNFEFLPLEGGKSGYDVFVKEFSDKMKFEIDVFWVKLGGVEPIELIKKLNGRVAQLHLKDLKSGLEIPDYDTGVPKDAFKELGNGVIPMKPIIEAAEKVGVAHCHVEQDQSPDPIVSIQQSMAYLNSL